MHKKLIDIGADVQFLKSQFKPTFIMLMVDGASAHRAKTTKKFHEKHGIKLFTGWPGNFHLNYMCIPVAGSNASPGDGDSFCDLTN